MNTIKSIKRSIPLLILSLLLVAASCKEQNYWSYLEHDDTPPGEVTNVEVTPLPGGAKITYDLPEGDFDLLYVMAKYEIRPGVKQETSASFYDQELLVQGFGNIDKHEVELYTVDRSGNKSKPIVIEVTPLKSPVLQVYDSLNIQPDFGGVRTYIKNLSKADLMIGVLVKDDLGDWQDLDAYYTSLPETNFAVRNLDAISTTFGVFVRDRWQNYSDTLIKTLIPLHEQELDKNKFAQLALPNDASNGWTFKGLWDGVPGTHQGIRSDDNNGMPGHYQFSLGTKAKISRFKLWGIIDGREYSSNNIKEFEIWGSNDPGSDGEFDSWELMGTFEVQKPSGLPDGEYTEDDRAQAQAGDDFDMPFDAPAVKYIRINVLSTFASPKNSQTGGIWLTEVSFWGQVQ